jgi:hypothetical protein
LSPRCGRLFAITDAPPTAGSGTRSSVAFYADSVDAFLRAADDEVYAPLASPLGYTLVPEQLSAWPKN